MPDRKRASDGGHGSGGPPLARAVALAVEDTPFAGRGLIVATITRVYTVRPAAKILGRVDELLWELADQLEPENGMLWKDLIAACIRHVTFASLRMT
jgi:hypothetical protein